MGKPPYILNPLYIFFTPVPTPFGIGGFFMLVKVPLLLYYK
nr:MAG TPA: hypothetical protein [Caudoviricetes sp.]